MKELSIEEKAKAYDEAIERAKYWEKNPTVWSSDDICQKLFPELKESEDKKPNGAIVMEDFNEGNGFYKVNLAYLNKEQVEDIENIIKRWNVQKYNEEAIRNCIGVILTDASEQRFVDFNTSLKDCLTWLEKQGQTFTKKDVDDAYLKGICDAKHELEKQGEKVKPIEGFNTEFERQVSCLIASAMNKDYEYTKDFVKWTSEGLLNYAKLEIEKNSMGISEATKQKLEDNLNKALEEETPESWNKFLEKQGEQKPVECRQETKPNGGIVSEDFNDGDGYYKVNLAYLSKSQVERIESLVASWQNPTNNTASWSEEDEKTYISILNDLRQDVIPDEEDIDWFKALKYRVQPQQEWGEEEQQIIKDAACIILDCVNTAETEIEEKRLEELADKLQDLKTQNTWRPSEEQLKSLEEVIDAGHYTSYPFALETLYKQLKQL